MKKNLILSGGVAHDYSETSPILKKILEEICIESEIHDDFSILETDLRQDFDLVTLNCVKWTCDQEEVTAWRDQWHYELPVTAQQNFSDFLSDGGGLLALHAATICFDDWPEFPQILGAYWEWGKSGHAPILDHEMEICPIDHPISSGIEDFVIRDELYTDPAIVDESIKPLIHASWDEKNHPILWTREIGEARVCYNALGHGVEAFENPVNRMLLQRSAQWILGLRVE